MVKADLLVFGAHPDDIEIGISGTIAKYCKQGLKVVLVDLTMGEMGTNGTKEIRLQEANLAASILGVIKRINLKIADRDIQLSKDNIAKVVEVIREYQASTLFYPYQKDYHPDHEAAYRLIREAIHTAGLRKFHTGQEPFRPQHVYNYYINDIEHPSLYVDISDVYDMKIQALKAHASQFTQGETSQNTYLNTGFLQRIENRDRYWGDLCHCSHAELLFSNKLPAFQIE